jgi:hypothetical protein
MIVGSLALFGCESDNGGGGRPAETGDLQNRSFTFTDGAVFNNGLAGQAVTLMVGGFTGASTTAPVRLSSGASTAVGRVTVSSCDFAFTSSTFEPGAGPQAGDGVSTDCNFDTGANTLQIEANGRSATSQAATDVQPTLSGVVYVSSNIGDGGNSIFAFRNTDGVLAALPGAPFLTGGSGVTTETIPVIGPFDSDQNIIVNANRSRLFCPFSHSNFCSNRN